MENSLHFKLTKNLENKVRVVGYHEKLCEYLEFTLDNLNTVVSNAENFTEDDLITHLYSLDKEVRSYFENFVSKDDFDKNDQRIMNVFFLDEGK